MLRNGKDTGQLTNVTPLPLARTRRSAAVGFYNTTTTSNNNNPQPQVDLNTYRTVRLKCLSLALDEAVLRTEMSKYGVVESVMVLHQLGGCVCVFCLQ